MRLQDNAALIVIDVQKGFDLGALWGKRNNPDAERHIATLCEMWEATGRPIVCVRHTADRVVSPFASWSPGRDLKPALVHVRFNVTIEKSVNSSFLGAPDLHAWLTDHCIEQVVIVGIQTNMCVELTARTAGNLGYDVIVPLDATHTFDLTVDGQAVSADELSRITAVNLAGGRFARVVTTAEVLGGFEPTADRPGVAAEVVTGAY